MNARITMWAVTAAAVLAVAGTAQATQLTDFVNSDFAYTRAQLPDDPSLDQVSIYLAGLPAAAAGQKLQMLEGDWSASAGGIALVQTYTTGKQTYSDWTQFTGQTAANSAASAAVYTSNVNFVVVQGAMTDPLWVETPAGLTDGQGVPLYSAFAGSWNFGSGTANQRGLGDLLATMYVTHGASLTFNGHWNNPGNYVPGGFGLSSGTTCSGGFTISASSTTFTWNQPAGAWTWDAASTGWTSNTGGTQYVDGAGVNFTDAGGGTSTTITIASAVKPGMVSFDNSAKSYTFTGAAISGATGVTKSGAGTVILATPNTYTGRTTVTAGTLHLAAAAQAPVLTGGGADVQGGKIVFDYAGSSPATTIANLLAASYDGRLWDTGQFRCATADGSHGLGWADDGSGQVTVMYTVYGDANLDGRVDQADMSLLMANYNHTGAGWSQGDFNYDGRVDGGDFNIVLSSFYQSVAISAAASVPEPGSAVLAAVAGLCLLAGARRQRKPAC
jgi:autotransporter-associated beta strand protein